MQDLRFFRNHYRQRDLLHAVNLMCSFKYHSLAITSFLYVLTKLHDYIAEALDFCDFRE